MCMFDGLFVCLQPLVKNQNSSWINGYKGTSGFQICKCFTKVNMHVCTLDSEGVLLECSIGMKEAQHEDNWSWSTYCNLRMVYYNWTIFTDHERQTSWQTTQRWYGQWLRPLQVTSRAMHKLCSWNSSHDFGVKFSPYMYRHSSCPYWQLTVTIPHYIVLFLGSSLAKIIYNHNLLLTKRYAVHIIRKNNRSTFKWLKCKLLLVLKWLPELFFKAS